MPLCAVHRHLQFKKMKDRDHNPRYRAVGVCGTSALLADDSEAPAKSVFLMGYSVGPLTGVLENLLVSCGFPKSKVNGLAKEIVKLSQVCVRGHMCTHSHMWCRARRACRATCICRATCVCRARILFRRWHRGALHVQCCRSGVGPEDSWGYLSSFLQMAIQH